jgi:hypothetical protein
MNDIFTLFLDRRGAYEKTLLIYLYIVSQFSRSWVSDLVSRIIYDPAISVAHVSIPILSNHEKQLTPAAT